MTIDVRDKEISLAAQVSAIGRDILVTVTGGKSHIGSISSAVPDKEGGVETSTLTYPGHKDAVIGDRFAERLCRLWGRKAVVLCGIHYDNASPELINHIVKKADELLERLCAADLQIYLQER